MINYILGVGITRKKVPKTQDIKRIVSDELGRKTIGNLQEVLKI